MDPRRFGSSPGELFAPSQTPQIAIDPSHRLVRMTELIDWAKLTAEIERLRRCRVGRAGRRPHLRALVGAMIFMSTQRITFRQAEDQIRHYAPARFLCGLCETDWTPDFTTLHDFAMLIGEEGLQIINRQLVRLAAELGLAQPKTAAADTTVQEAAIAYPNEMGLMSRFVGSLGKACQRAGGALGRFWKKAAAKVRAVKHKVRRQRLFAKTAAARSKLTGQVATLVGALQQALGRALERALRAGKRLRGQAKVALVRASELHRVMKELLPQIRSWLCRGKVARGKIISLHMPQLHALVRGKAGKEVEFGWNWGILRVGGGYLLGRPERTAKEISDSKFALEAVKMNRETFGQVPESYAYDRAGWSRKNLEALSALGVKNVGVAPRGKAPWAVAEPERDRLARERAKVEGCIGSIKSLRYGFNRPAARSVAAMKACGLRAIVGFNLNKLVRDLGRREGFAVAG